MERKLPAGMQVSPELYQQALELLDKPDPSSIEDAVATSLADWGGKLTLNSVAALALDGLTGEQRNEYAELLCQREAAVMIRDAYEGAATITSGHQEDYHADNE